MCSLPTWGLQTDDWLATEEELSRIPSALKPFQERLIAIKMHRNHKNSAYMATLVSHARVFQCSFKEHLKFCQDRILRTPMAAEAEIWIIRNKEVKVRVISQIAGHQISNLGRGTFMFAFRFSQLLHCASLSKRMNLQDTTRPRHARWRSEPVRNSICLKLCKSVVWEWVLCAVMI